MYRWMNGWMKCGGRGGTWAVGRDEMGQENTDVLQLYRTARLTINSNDVCT